MRSAATPARPFPAYLVPPVLLIYAALVLQRMPQILLKTRFWGEEGTIFFHNAWTMPPLQALLTPYGGYLNIMANGATLGARWLLPLEDAPYLTIGTGLVFQLCPPLLLLLARDGWLADWRVRLAGVAMLLTVPAADEIWLQTLHCQFELALCAGLILALEVPRGGRAAFALFLLALGPLCGPGAIVFVPLFLLRAGLDRSPGRAVQAVVLTAAAAVQLLLFFSSESGRAFAFDPVILLGVIAVKNIALPLLGFFRAQEVALALKNGHFLPLILALPVVAFLLLAAWSLRTRNGPAIWMLVGGSLSALAAYFGALDGTVALVNSLAGSRYAVVPQSLFALTFLSLAASDFDWRRAVLAGGFCLWLLIVGIGAYRHPWPNVADGPDWRTEVAAWRADPTHRLELWPAPWILQLSPR